MTVAKRLGAGAVVLGLAAPFAGSPYTSARGHLDVDDIAHVIARGEDHITPLQLAAMIRDRQRGLRVIDVRRPTDFAEYAIPSAENIPIELLPRASFAPQETLVLYSEGGAHAAQAWMMLRAMGHRSVYFISGGLVDWYHDVMAPVLPSDASAQARETFEITAELSRYFGGEPRIGDVAREMEVKGTEANVSPRIAKMRRRGC
jgi:rhodanese-related sulfurtransferase